MVEDFAAVGEALRTCARCGKPAPEFHSGVPEDQGWYVLEAGLICGDCMTAEDWREAEGDSLRALEWRRRLRSDDDQD